MKINKYHIFLLCIVSAFFVWSAINPHDYFTWLLEVFPAVVGAAIIFPTYRKFRLSNLMYTLIAIHAIILMIGGHSTYALAPVGEWMKQIFGFTRNNYDKIGHLAQGFMPAIYVREVLIRKSPLTKHNSFWLPFISISVVLAASALYELIEWWVSLASGSAGDSFLGTQGYIWDTQSDMFLALVGALAGLLILNKLHDRSMQKAAQP
ncbi:MAG: hypothetical protein A2750_01060 [Candidatus Yanofskybacteria bacterium RIFCSPHIGHO2_01_FULL_45_42]|uniref:DUF2238 domain-containing protein n=3 Tax=Candidatus Yanofskyibacteriota TaxID=1752733 RepID=A0A1F8H2T5_9BACT|nr:MAG: hypothetical protein A2750_01060 [Candidatus Yanofskybacteria bacterium RIFCSPHIGHO2_01_FULL_45_42]OGN15502.1 MAG: hypothetical protein A3C81_01250 [Candidatus Yanofskybacteria bacterium RIFCSPHIGHO2_02_FULL_46_19]OGN27209.1 MAG: hypothetical protein A3B17_01160 [Candidatus Yanofskybacteria bacterium RIFCSPLOWO2_01_FULL_45_72]OGN31871.1 MAG: hypothetical protein A3J01_01795 [Candidatus Yanofskybacteria bacterium RIFCSPLOWO2_02_FULL_45_18]